MSLPGTPKGRRSNPPRGTARVGGVRIAYEYRGSGPALVCCHAFGVDRTMWEAQVPRFAETHQVITFDQRGSGESDHPVPVPGEPDPYTLDTFGDDLRGVLDDLGIERARVLGLSMGGATALSFATRWPERVEALILASAMASRLPEAIISRARLVEQVLAGEGLREAYRLYFDGPLFKGVARDARFNAQIEAWAAGATPHGFAGNYRVTIDRPSLFEALDRIHAPTLVLVGENDTYYLAEAEAMARRIPGARKVIMKGVGHAMSVEAPEQFAKVVLAFLDRGQA
ncbi:MAG: alpha/beta hydrolase [Deltaproteobacteria bacterium]|nr:alpha/beta hydrolase [Deltaproteobacteria bacterium]